MRRESLPLKKAAKAEQIDPKTVLHYVGSALRRSGRDYWATPYDRLSRSMYAVTSRGIRPITLSDSREASLLGEYWTAVQGYLQTGDDSALRSFRRALITDANGRQIRLLTNLNELDRLGNAGVLSFESLYARGA
jgi:hypothetical protein